MVAPDGSHTRVHKVVGEQLLSVMNTGWCVGSGKPEPSAYAGMLYLSRSDGSVDGDSGIGTLRSKRSNEFLFAYLAGNSGMDATAYG